MQDQFAALGLDEQGVDRAVAFYRERFTQHGLYENHVYEGIEGALDALGAASVPMAVATSKPSGFATRLVEHFDLAPHFALVEGATLDGTRRMKADVIGFAITSLGAAPGDAVMVGDRAQDIDGARAHGMRSIGVSWGYAEPGETRASRSGLGREVTAGADRRAPGKVPTCSLEIDGALQENGDQG